MTLALSKGHPQGQGKEGWELLSSRKSEKQARALSQPSYSDDCTQIKQIHANGNTKPQEPPYLLRRPSGSAAPPRMVNHMHAKPWCFCMAPGRKENPHHTNPYHRVWMADAGRQGRVYDGIDASNDHGAPRRWNKDRKMEHYKQYEAELNALKPHDEIFAIGTNAKFWTHLNNKGTQSGGQEKLEYVPPRRPLTGRHVKGSLYLGKFSNVQHAQLILKTGFRNKRNELEEWHIDTRPPFDNRLHDDMVKYNQDNDRFIAQAGYAFFRPTNTRSCPQMGAEYMNR